MFFKLIDANLNGQLINFTVEHDNFEMMSLMNKSYCWCRHRKPKQELARLKNQTYI